MIKKKKARVKVAGKKAGKRKRVSIRRNKNKELNPVGTWKDVAALVESHAAAMAEAVIEEGEKGHVSPVKFLFEMAKIGPPPEGTEATEEEESLAKTLFRTLNLPIVPLPADQDEAEETVVIPANAAGAKNEEGAEEKSGEAEKVGVSE